MTITVPGLPELRWTHHEGTASVDPDARTLTVTSAERVDWINDARTGERTQSSTALVFDPPAGDWTLSARVTVPGPRTTFDAGVLTLWSHQDRWAKLCFEYSPAGEPMVVSVVTDVHSDDANATVVDGSSVFLRIARVGEAYAFHSSLDGHRWDFVRVFRLTGGDDPVAVGLLSQAPTAGPCVAVFDTIDWRPGHTVTDLRDGS